jgi:hypothetical protein
VEFPRKKGGNGTALEEWRGPEGLMGESLREQAEELAKRREKCKIKL